MNYLEEPQFAQTALGQRSTGWLYTSRGSSSGHRGGRHGGGRGSGRMGGFAAGPEDPVCAHAAGIAHLM
ncbi:MAG: hypothetical protein OEY88_00060 [Candidatus Bathyarchaeota archaeon]|nr:hypothetical protein [Candidatus Bathyarchaeota archaeon]